MTGRASKRQQKNHPKFAFVAFQPVETDQEVIQKRHVIRSMAMRYVKQSKRRESSRSRPRMVSLRPKEDVRTSPTPSSSSRLSNASNQSQHHPSNSQSFTPPPEFPAFYAGPDRLEPFGASPSPARSDIRENTIRFCEVSDASSPPSISSNCSNAWMGSGSDDGLSSFGWDHQELVFEDSAIDFYQDVYQDSIQKELQALSEEALFQTGRIQKQLRGWVAEAGQNYRKDRMVLRSILSMVSTMISSGDKADDITQARAIMNAARQIIRANGGLENFPQSFRRATICFDAFTKASPCEPLAWPRELVYEATAIPSIIVGAAAEAHMRNLPLIPAELGPALRDDLFMDLHLIGLSSVEPYREDYLEHTFISNSFFQSFYKIQDSSVREGQLRDARLAMSGQYMWQEPEFYDTLIATTIPAMDIFAKLAALDHHKPHSKLSNLCSYVRQFAQLDTGMGLQAWQENNASELLLWILYVAAISSEVRGSLRIWFANQFKNVMHTNMWTKQDAQSILQAFPTMRALEVGAGGFWFEVMDDM